MSVSNRNKTYQELRGLVDTYKLAPYKLIHNKYITNESYRGLSHKTIAITGSRSCWDCGKQLESKKCGEECEATAYCSEAHRLNDEKRNPKIVHPRKSNPYQDRMVVFHFPRTPPSTDRFHLAVGTAFYLMERDGWHVSQMLMTTDRDLHSHRISTSPLVGLSSMTSPPSLIFRDIVALWIERGMNVEEMMHPLDWSENEEIHFLDLMIQLTGKPISVNQPNEIEAVPWMIKHGLDLSLLSGDFATYLENTSKHLKLLRLALENGLDVNELEMYGNRNVPRWFIILDDLKSQKRFRKFKDLLTKYINEETAHFRGLSSKEFEALPIVWPIEDFRGLMAPELPVIRMDAHHARRATDQDDVFMEWIRDDEKQPPDGKLSISEMFQQMARILPELQQTRTIASPPKMGVMYGHHHRTFTDV